MSNTDIQELLAKLREEVQNVDLDADTQSVIRELDADIHDLLESSDADARRATVLERARSFETDFQSRHPIAARIVSEIIEALARMGV